MRFSDYTVPACALEDQRRKRLIVLVPQTDGSSPELLWSVLLQTYTGVSADGLDDGMCVKSCRCISHSVWLLVAQLTHFTDNTRSKPALSLNMEVLACGSVSWASVNVCAAIDGSISMNDPHGRCRL